MQTITNQYELENSWDALNAGNNNNVCTSKLTCMYSVKWIDHYFTIHSSYNSTTILLTKTIYIMCLAHIHNYSLTNKSK